jgi:hypothetical protein
MANDFIAIEVQGLKELIAALEKLPPEAQDAAIDEASKYMLNVLRAYPPQKYVSRQSAYGKTFFSDKQRRFFFAALKDGRIGVPYSRTQSLSKGWKILDKGKDAMLVNESPHADLVMGDNQSRHAAKIGWKKHTQQLQERKARIIEVANAAVKKVLRRLKLGN